jgi:hypothetical protein
MSGTASGLINSEAMKELNAVAGYFFGKNFKNLISRRSTDKSLVEMGEIEAVEDQNIN